MNDRNSEGYRDPTAARAIRNVEREEERKIFRRVPKFIYEMVRALNNRLQFTRYELTEIRLCDRGSGTVYTWEDGGWK